nr:hypothetical protein [Tanacetum cinerariifolium]
STFSNPLFDDSTSSDDESSYEEVIHEMIFKTYSNLLFDLDEEIISSEFNPIHNEDLDSTLKNDRFNTESYLLESLLNHDTMMASSLKIDSLLAEFAGELIFLKSILPRTDEANCDPEEDIHLVERLLYDNSSPHLPKEFVFENSNADIKYFSPSPIPIKDSDSCKLFGSGFTVLLAVATTFTGSGNLYSQWELGSGFIVLLAVATIFTGSGNLYSQWEL